MGNAAAVPRPDAASAAQAERAGDWAPRGPMTIDQVDDAEPGDPTLLPPATTADRPVTVYKLGDFKLKQKIGQGQFSVVRLAMHVMEQKHYAIKTITKSDAIASRSADRVVMEARLLAALDHPFIPKLLGASHDDFRGTFRGAASPLPSVTSPHPH